jgi:hypothetical protein
MKKYYVYVFIDPRDESIFYVGKGSGNRISAHRPQKHNPHLFSKLEKIRKLGLIVRREIIANFSDEAEAYEFERNFINEIGIENLTNIAPGGLGGPGYSGPDHPMYGKHQTEAARAKMSEKVKAAYADGRLDNRGQKSPNYGKELSSEHKQKLSAAHKGEKHYYYGKELTEEHKRKKSETLKRRFANGELDHMIQPPTYYGEQHPRARLTILQIEEARKLYATKLWTLKQLGEKYKVARSTIGRAISGKTYNSRRQ